MVTGSASRRRPAGRLLTLLVMTVLAGVLGMHGLGPHGAMPPASSQAAHPMALTHADPVPEAGAPCAHLNGGTGHLAHADAACAATGTSSPYMPLALCATLSDAPVCAMHAAGAPGTVTSGRAPPDLSELQLLRI
ncbi:DUF6153 family protein [Streptomyces sp. MMBL 11-3]|uniref:DUF6153 family protein n=1 Tax=Streptomyces sp. MMBL 11-3 TaxID=3382639 RepID=UPI0039B54543